MLSTSAVRTARLKRYGKLVITGVEQQAGVEGAPSTGPTSSALESKEPE